QIHIGLLRCLIQNDNQVYHIRRKNTRCRAAKSARCAKGRGMRKKSCARRALWYRIESRTDKKELHVMWAYESVFYQIYPLGFCGAPFENDGAAEHRILKVLDWIEHLEKLGVNA